ncbi:alpha/beta fold hydrolase [Flavitalea antarctica]
MKQILPLPLIVVFNLSMIITFPMKAQQTAIGNYATINNLNMYYEIHGSGQPLVLLHGGGSTISSTYGKVLPELARKHKVIAIELQAHGRTKDIDRPLSFEQDADDVAALLNKLGIKKANFLGFSNGGTTTLQFAIRHSELVNRIVLASTIFQREGMVPGFFEGMKQANFDQMPMPLKKAYLDVNNDQAGLMQMFNRDVARMVGFEDISIEKIKTISAPALVINGDKEVVLAKHALFLSETLANARLLIVPAGHGDYIGEISSGDKNNQLPGLVVQMINQFFAGEH